MIPEEIGYRKQIKIDELPQWVIDLRAGKFGEEIHKSMYQTRSQLEIHKLDEKYVIVQRYAPGRRLEALVITVANETTAKEHERFDLIAEHEYERHQDMKADMYMDMLEDRDDDDIDW